MPDKFQIEEEKSLAISLRIGRTLFLKAEWSKKLADAFKVIQEAMIEDSCMLDSYANTWHQNIANACYKAINNNEYLEDMNTHIGTQIVANDAATRFMKVCFGVDTQHEEEIAEDFWG